MLFVGFQKRERETEQIHMTEKKINNFQVSLARIRIVYVWQLIKIQFNLMLCYVCVCAFFLFLLYSAICRGLNTKIYWIKIELRGISEICVELCSNNANSWCCHLDFYINLYIYDLAEWREKIARFGILFLDDFN